MKFNGSFGSWLKRRRRGLGLTQNERERLLSDIVWQLTCFVEGSITKARGLKGIPLEYGFKLLRLEQEGKQQFCVVKHD